MSVSHRPRNPWPRGRRPELKGQGEPVSSRCQNTSQWPLLILLLRRSRLGWLHPLLETERETKTEKRGADLTQTTTEKCKHKSGWRVNSDGCPAYQLWSIYVDRNHRYTSEFLVLPDFTIAVVFLDKNYLDKWSARESLDLRDTFDIVDHKRLLDNLEIWVNLSRLMFKTHL